MGSTTTAHETLVRHEYARSVACDTGRITPNHKLCQFATVTARPIGDSWDYEIDHSRVMVCNCPCHGGRKPSCCDA